MFHFFILTNGVVMGCTVGAMLGAQYVPQHSLAVGIVAGLLGAPAGLGLAILHIRLVMWLVGPDLPQTASRLTGFIAKLCEYLYGYSMLYGSLLSFLFLMIAVAILLKPEPFQIKDNPSQFSRGQALALSASLAVLGYLQMALVHRLAVWFETRGNGPGPPP